MKICENKTKSQSNYAPGTVLQHRSGYYLAGIIDANKYLFSLKNGRVWASNSMYGLSSHTEFTMVDGCFQVE